jgi:hypothetical protein
MHVCDDTMGLGLWEYFQGFLTMHQPQLSISFGGIGLIFMEDCAPFVFLRNWALVISHLCSRFHILEKYVSQVERARTCFSYVYM